MHHQLQQYTPLTLLRNRWRSLLALLITTCVLLALSTGPNLEQDSQILEQHYQIALTDLQMLYGTLFGLSLLAVWFEPQLHREVSDGKATALVACVVTIVSFMSVRLAVPLPEFRTFIYPGRLWWVIVGLIALCALAISRVSLNPFQPVSPRTKRYGLALLVGFGILLIVMHILSLSDYPRLDTLDEPWSASIAANWAENHAFRSHFNGDLFDEIRYYYIFMGTWARLWHSTALQSLRSFSLFIGLFTTCLFAFTLTRLPHTPPLQIVAGTATLIGLVSFTRTSHSLRQDVGLALYSTLILLALINISESRQRAGWLYAAGLALIIGLMTIPTYAVLFAFSIGLLLVVYFIYGQWVNSALENHVTWQAVAGYAAGCATAGLLMLAIYIISNQPDPLDTFHTTAQAYQAENSRWLHVSAESLGYLFRRYARLSPVEGLLVLIATGVALWRGTSLDRCVVVLLVLAAITAVFPWFLLEGYLALLTPFMAYLIARLLRLELPAMIILFALLPAVFSSTLSDMHGEMLVADNMRMIAEADLLTWQIPEDITVVGENKFWFTLHEHRRFVSWVGVKHYADLYSTDPQSALRRLDTEVAFCLEGSEPCTLLAASPDYATPTDFTISDGNYLVFRRVTGE